MSDIVRDRKKTLQPRALLAIRPVDRMTLALAILYPLGLFATTWRAVPSGKVSPPRSGPTAAADEAGNTWLFGGYAEEEGKPRGVVNDLMRYSAASDATRRPVARRPV